MVTRQTIIRGCKKAVLVIVILMKYIIPAILVLKILEHSGWLVVIANFFAPYMAFMGLPGAGALIIMLGQVSLYSAVAAMLTLGLTIKQITIMSTFISIFHAFAIETVVVIKGGGNGPLIVVLRFIAAVSACVVLNLIIPGV